MPVFHTMEQSEPENHGNICALTPGDALKLMFAEEHAVSQFLNLLEFLHYKGKPQNFQRVFFFWESCG